MAYSVSNGDIISLSKSGRTPQSMTTSVPLHTFTGDLDPIQLWKTQPAVRTVIDFLAATQAGIPLNLYRVVNETDRQRIRSGPVASALRQARESVTSFNLRRDLLTDRLIFDRFVVFKHFHHREHWNFIGSQLSLRRSSSPLWANPPESELLSLRAIGITISLSARSFSMWVTAPSSGERTQSGVLPSLHSSRFSRRDVGLG